MLILLLAGAGLMGMLLHLIYQKYWTRSLTVQVCFAQGYVYEGEKTTLREEITNQKKLPLPALEVRLAVSRHLEFSGDAGQNASVSDQTYQRDIFALWGCQKVIRTLPVKCRKRGFFRITKSEIVGTDFFYENQYYLELPQETQLYVYPRQIDVRRLQMVCQAVSGMILAKRRLYPDPFEFSGIREYSVSDPMNHINWKASARSSELMVNQFDSTTNVTVTVVLDVEDSGILRYEELTEESIRIASSLAAELLGKGMELDLLSNGIVLSEEGNGKETLSMHLKNGAGLLQELNQKLARTDISQSVNGIEKILASEKTGRTKDRILILISKNHRESVQEMMEQMAADGSQILWVIPMHRNMEPGCRNSQRIREIRWEVE